MKNIIALLTIVALALCFPPQWSDAIRSSICGPQEAVAEQPDVNILWSTDSLWPEVDKADRVKVVLPTNCDHRPDHFVMWPGYSPSQTYIKGLIHQEGLGSIQWPLYSTAQMYNRSFDETDAQ